MPTRRAAAPADGGDVDVDVAIIGCGPVGAALATGLGRRGIRVAVLDRNRGVLPIPRAVHIDGETMRVFQSLGLARPLLSVMRAGTHMHWVNPQGRVLLVRRGLDGIGPQGWHGDYYFHQPRLEQVIRDAMAALPSVRLCEGVEVVGLTPSPDGVALALTGAGAPSRLRAKYVVGCDGARSTVRGWIGGDELEDLGEHRTWLVVDAVLDRPLDLPEHSVQHCDPRRPATSIYIDPLRRRWELMLLPGEDPRALVAPAHVWSLLSRWVRPTQARLERAATYTFHPVVANRWQSGRIFIAGDAAHQTPPFLGQGLCAGLRDVANLGWKLAAALAEPDRAEPLLATYGTERRPPARALVALAVEVGRIIQETDPVRAAARDARLLAEGLALAMPLPRLGPGLHLGGIDDGCLFVQPCLSDGRWLDDAVGPRFAVVVNPRHAAHWLADCAALARTLAQADLAVVVEPPREATGEAGPDRPTGLTGPDRLTDWFDAPERGAPGTGYLAVVLRPDRYVFAACRDANALVAAVAQLRLPSGRP